MGLSFLLNLFFYVSGINRQLSLLITSAVMATSYFISNHLVKLSFSYWVYLEWIAYDLLVILLIYLIHKLRKIEFCTASFYVFLGLSINSMLFFIMFIDLHFFENKDSWWFWHLYTILVNSVDILMISVLILNRDLLGFFAIKKRFSS